MNLAEGSVTTIEIGIPRFIEPFAGIPATQSHA